jgi:hypothetical protein
MFPHAGAGPSTRHPIGMTYSFAAMGFFSDSKDARPIEAGDVTVVPAQRIDTSVADPASGAQRRRTDYAGTAWYGGRPQLIGENARSGPGARVDAPFWLPDSHTYETGDMQIQATAAVQGGLVVSNGGSFMILEVEAALGEHPDGGLKLFVTVVAVARLPLGVAYRVTVV